MSDLTWRSGTHEVRLPSELLRFSPFRSRRVQACVSEPAPPALALPKPGRQEVPTRELAVWTETLRPGLEARRDALPPLFTLMGKPVQDEPQLDCIYARHAGAIVRIEAEADEDISGKALHYDEIQLHPWRRRYACEPLTFPVSIHWLDGEPAQESGVVDPDWLQGALWRTPFQLLRRDLLRLFGGQLQALYALIAQAEPSGERTVVEAP